MIIAPFNTDAPLYHRPWGTAGLIALNVLIGLCIPYEMLVPFALHYGHGLTPLQWVTSSFVHADVLHLLGNMFFLWGFGLIVEGKLGWQRFVPLYLLISALECAAEQLLFMNTTGVSLGASSAIFGLMAIALIWAPRNELMVFYWLFFRFGVTEISVLLFSGFLLLKSALICSLTGVTPTKEVLHLLGALFGALFGLLFVMRRWVDCEGWDLISILRGHRPRSTLLHEPLVEKVASKRKRRAEPANGPLPGSPEKFSRLIAHGKPLAALNELRQIRGFNSAWQPQPQESLELARALRKQHDWKQALDFYKEHLNRCQHVDPAVRLEIAEILILVVEHPQAALNVLAPTIETSLSPKRLAHLKELRHRAHSMIEEGTLELRDDGWAGS